jgi:type IV secretion system protein VirD4
MFRRRQRRDVRWYFEQHHATIDTMDATRSGDERTREPSTHAVEATLDAWRADAGGIYLGMAHGAWSWSGPQRSALVLGPSRSGKTSSLVIPNLLLAEGPVVSTSTKPDVMEATAPSRAEKGYSFLFDPSGEIDCPRSVERVGWSPLTTAADWDCAVQTSDAMVNASHLSSGGASQSAGEHHWSERASALLSPLLHAAALESIPMRSVVRWIDRHDGATPLQILSKTVGDDATATDLLAGIVGTDAREQSGIWSTASGVLAAYRSEAAMASTELSPLDVAEFCRGANTMYICAAGRRQNQFAPLVVGAIGDVRDGTYDRERADGGMAPTLLALDEVANIAPLPDLVTMLSEGAGQGLLVMACLQDLSQARTRWGRAADGFLTLFGTTVVFPGIADVATLRDLSAIAGDHELATTTVGHSVGHHGRVRPSSSVSTVRVPRLPVDVLARGEPGCARVLTPQRAYRSVELTPAHACSPWREMTAAGRARAERAPVERAPLERPPSGRSR